MKLKEESLSELLGMEVEARPVSKFDDDAPVDTTPQYDLSASVPPMETEADNLLLESKPTVVNDAESVFSKANNTELETQAASQKTDAIVSRLNKVSNIENAVDDTTSLLPPQLDKENAFYESMWKQLLLRLDVIQDNLKALDTLVDPTSKATVDDFLTKAREQVNEKQPINISGLQESLSKIEKYVSAMDTLVTGVNDIQKAMNNPAGSQPVNISVKSIDKVLDAVESLQSNNKDSVYLAQTKETLEAIKTTIEPLQDNKLVAEALQTIAKIDFKAIAEADTKQVAMSETVAKELTKITNLDTVVLEKVKSFDFGTFNEVVEKSNEVIRQVQEITSTNKTEAEYTQTVMAEIAKIDFKPLEQLKTFNENIINNITSLEKVQAVDTTLVEKTNILNESLLEVATKTVDEKVTTLPDVALNPVVSTTPLVDIAPPAPVVSPAINLDPPVQAAAIESKSAIPTEADSPEITVRAAPEASILKAVEPDLPIEKIDKLPQIETKGPFQETSIINSLDIADIGIAIKNAIAEEIQTADIPVRVLNSEDQVNKVKDDTSELPVLVAEPTRTPDIKPVDAPVTEPTRTPDIKPVDAPVTDDAPVAPVLVTEPTRTPDIKSVDEPVILNNSTLVDPIKTPDIRPLSPPVTDDIFSKTATSIKDDIKPVDIKPTPTIDAKLLDNIASLIPPLKPVELTQPVVLIPDVKIAPITNQPVIDIKPYVTQLPNIDTKQNVNVIPNVSVAPKEPEAVVTSPVAPNITPAATTQPEATPVPVTPVPVTPVPVTPVPVAQPVTKGKVSIFQKLKDQVSRLFSPSRTPTPVSEPGNPTASVAESNPKKSNLFSKLFSFPKLKAELSPILKTVDGNAPVSPLIDSDIKEPSIDIKPEKTVVDIKPEKQVDSNQSTVIESNAQRFDRLQKEKLEKLNSGPAIDSIRPTIAEEAIRQSPTDVNVVDAPSVKVKEATEAKADSFISGDAPEAGRFIRPERESDSLQAPTTPETFIRPERESDDTPAVANTDNDDVKPVIRQPKEAVSLAASGIGKDSLQTKALEPIDQIKKVDLQPLKNLDKSPFEALANIDFTSLTSLNQNITTMLPTMQSIANLPGFPDVKQVSSSMEPVNSISLESLKTVTENKDIFQKQLLEQLPEAMEKLKPISALNGDTNPVKEIVVNLMAKLQPEISSFINNQVSLTKIEPDAKQRGLDSKVDNKQVDSVIKEPKFAPESSSESPSIKSFAGTPNVNPVDSGSNKMILAMMDKQNDTLSKMGNTLTELTNASKSLASVPEAEASSIAVSTNIPAPPTDNSSMVALLQELVASNKKIATILALQRFNTDTSRSTGER